MEEEELGEVELSDVDELCVVLELCGLELDEDEDDWLVLDRLEVEEGNVGLVDEEG